jgi:hypothetical protein
MSPLCDFGRSEKQLWCEASRSDCNWKLEFGVRDDAGEG